MRLALTLRRGRAGFAVASALLLALAAIIPSPSQTLPAVQAIIFEVELPELGLAPTSKPEVSIPSPALETIVLHVLRPQSDQIDYSQIGTHINGRPAAAVASIVTGERGKQVRIDLKRYPDFKLLPGRNTVEILARNRRGREFYASFVLRTVTENRNREFGYEVATSSKSKSQVPPELVLIQPESEIIMPPGAKARKVRISGVATAATSVTSVSINGQPVALKRGPQVTIRGMGLVHESNRVGFDLTLDVVAGATQVTVEATDAEGNRTRLSIPVRAGEHLQAVTFTGRKYALVVGISKFRNHEGGLQDLNYADADAREFERFLRTPAGGRFSSENILLLLNEQATLGRLQEAMSSFVSRPGPEDLLVIFIATHGVPQRGAEQNIYFVAHDTHVERLPETGFEMKEFFRTLQNNLRSRRMIMLVDTCHSAGLTASSDELSRGIRNNLVNLHVEKYLYGEEGKAVLTASDVSEASREASHWGGGHGVFTYFLLEGMRGMADLNVDRLVTVGELFRYVRKRVQDETGNKQNPRVLINTNDNLALALIQPSGAE